MTHNDDTRPTVTHTFKYTCIRKLSLHNIADSKLPQIMCYIMLCKRMNFIEERILHVILHPHLGNNKYYIHI